MRRTLPALALATLGLPLLAGAVGNSASQNAPVQTAAAPAATPAETRPVVVDVARFVPRVPERTFVGTIRAQVESDMGFRVAGKIAERLVQQGERVRAGQPLFRLDVTDFRLQKEQADAELRAARINLDQAVAQERRTVELRRNGWTTDQVIERTVATTAEARARLDRAQRQVELANNQMSYAVLAADTDGVVTQTSAEPGQVVPAGQPVLRVARAGQREAVVAIPELLVERVRAGTASVTLWSRPGVAYKATLREFAAAADPATRTFQARFAVEADDADLALGMTATVTIADPATAAIVRLPVSALFAQGSGASVWVVDAATGALTLKPVTIAGYEGREVLIGAGLADGDRVVSLGGQKLDPGQRVRIVETRG